LTAVRNRITSGAGCNLSIQGQEPQHRGYQINALGTASLPPAAFKGATSLQDLLADRVHPRVTERLARLDAMNPEQSAIRRELLRRLLESTSATSVAFQERVFSEPPEEEDVITFDINEAGEVTILLG
jgi:hypothetical protein